MGAKFYYFEFVIIYFLTLVPWPHPHVIKLICSKDNTRLVRKLIQSKWMPIFDKYQVKLPLECPLHPIRDIFAPQQDAKNKNRPTQWTCRLCGKSFFEEKFVDNHFENRHRDVINRAEDAVCLADFCDIMRCEVFAAQDSNLIIEDSFMVTDVEVWGNSIGHSLTVAQAAYLRKNNYFLSALMPSSPTSKSENLYSGHYQHQQISKEPQQLTDDRENKRINNNNININNNINNNNNNNQNNIINDNNNSSLNEENQGNFSEDNRKPQATSGHPEGNNGQKFRSDCKSEELEKLKVKCEYLIRTCVTGLLLQMSDYAFKEMEGDLNKAICWYLTCDRYWEDGPLETKAFPWGLILVLVMVLSLGICFCYYIIWILFDSEETISNIPQRSHHSPRYMQKGVLDRRKDNSRASMLVGTMSDCGEQDIMSQNYADESAVRPENSDLSHSEHYIYVTYPPDLKRRLLEKFE